MRDIKGVTRDNFLHKLQGITFACPIEVCSNGDVLADVGFKSYILKLQNFAYPTWSVLLNEIEPMTYTGVVRDGVLLSIIKVYEYDTVLSAKRETIGVPTILIKRHEYESGLNGTVGSIVKMPQDYNEYDDLEFIIFGSARGNNRSRFTVEPSKTIGHHVSDGERSTDPAVHIV